MVQDKWDIIVVGGGITGLTATALLSSLQLKVLCIEPNKPALKQDNIAADLRSTAYLLKSVELLKAAGVWEQLEDQAEQLKIMRICDVGGQNETIHHENYFDSKEIDLPQFGYNIPNWFVKKTFLKKIQSLKESQIMCETKVTSIMVQMGKVIVKLSNNNLISAKLIVAADGRNSDIRFLSDISLKKWDNGQDALAFMVTHEKQHNNNSIEILKTGGPCTFVPLKNTRDGEFQSAVVWMEKRQKAKSLMRLNEKDFSLALSKRTKFVLGKCNLNSRRTIYPIITQLADEFYSDRVALIGETAHVMPPIGAQGLNTSFEDIAMLVNLIKDALEKGTDIGSMSLLSKYGRVRRRITKSKILGITLLNKASQANEKITQNLRKLGLGLIKKNQFVRTSLMKIGIGKL